eukprot:m.239191 g.239191  ORF g.239191 m.239191 type:complete len:695 (+) comp13443_c0_seq1:36-2120(+)
MFALARALPAARRGLLAALPQARGSARTDVRFSSLAHSWRYAAAGHQRLALPRARFSSGSASDGTEETTRKPELDSKPESKVEKTVRALIQKKIEEQDNLNYTLLGSFKDPPAPVLPWYQRTGTYLKKLGSDMLTRKWWSDTWVAIKKELHHYKDGFVLMWVEVRISTRLLGQVVRGHALTRREREQFVRTASDLMRLVPLIVVIVVPFMEFALPFALKIWPNMLPSTFQDKEAKSLAELKVKLEMARFLQAAVEEMAVEAKAKRGESQSVADLAEFFERSRRRGHVHTDEILRFAKLFDDELTLDNLPHGTLRALCKLLNLPTLGTSNMLRFRLRVKLRELKADDLVIMKEGVESLTVPELQQACRERGMRALGISEEGLRIRLNEWLSLHLKDNVPQSLLLMSRLLYVPEDVPQVEKLKIAINSLPDSVRDEVRVELEEVEGADVDNAARIKILLNEEKLIKQEQLEDTAAVKAPPQIAAPAAEKLVDRAPVIGPAGAKDVTIVHKADERPITAEELVELAFAVLSMSDILQEERRAVAALKAEMQEHKQDLSKLKAESGAALAVPDVSVKLASRVEKMVAQLDAKLAERQKSLQFSTDRKGRLISTEELMAIMKKLQRTPSEHAMQVITATLDTDADGYLAVDVIKKVLNVVAQEGADIKPRDLRMLTQLIERENAISPATDDGPDALTPS